MRLWPWLRGRRDAPPAWMLRSALDQAIDAVVLIDTANAVTFFNAAAERLWGYERHEVMGRNVAMLVPEAIHAGHDALGARATASPSARRAAAARAPRAGAGGASRPYRGARPTTAQGGSPAPSSGTNPPPTPSRTRSARRRGERGGRPSRAPHRLQKGT